MIDAYWKSVNVNHIMSMVSGKWLHLLQRPHQKLSQLVHSKHELSEGAYLASVIRPI